MESPAARSLALHAVRCFLRQRSPVLNAGVLLDQQRFGALGGCPPSVDAGVVDLKPRGLLTTRSELTNDEVLPRDRAISHLDALESPIRNAEVDRASGRLNCLHVMDSFSRSGTLVRYPEFDDLLLNSAQRQQKELLALLGRRTSGRDLPMFSPYLAGSSCETRSFVTMVTDSSAEACNNSCVEQAMKPSLASLLGCVEVGLRFSLDNIPLECSSVKRKRKKKMNKHKQRKLRRRDRHRNS